jgi:Starch-binding associating with outer membrane
MKKIYVCLLLIAFSTTSCDKDFGDINVNTKKPSEVPPGALFSFATKSLTDAMHNSNVNVNIFRMLAQQWTETTYIDEANYDLATRDIPQNFWNNIYLNVIKSLNESQRLIPNQGVLVSKGTQANQDACIEILNVYAYSILVNTFGNIPYTEALNSDNVYPKYDDAATIYADLLKRLDAAIAKIKESETGFDANDLLYGGDMAGWKTFGYTLKLKLGMMLADVNPTLAKTAVEAAADHILTDNHDNVTFHYLSAPPNTNQVWVDLVQSGRKDFVAANTIVNAMIALNDPRIPLYFTKDSKGIYSGGIYAANNNYSTYSKPSTIITAPDFEALYIDAAEVHFLLAEAAERGMTIKGTAKEHYDEGVKASIEYWGGSSTDADTYLAQPTVAYATATGDYRQKIGTQKWLALYNRGFDAWTEWRRLDYPVLTPPKNKTQDDIPKRYTYPVQEQNLNTNNYNAASTAVGGDNVKTKLFWDKK